MITLKIPDMSCGHCAGVITKALKEIDPQAVLSFDMPNHGLQVETTQTADAVARALAGAGYPATPAS